MIAYDKAISVFLYLAILFVYALKAIGLTSSYSAVTSFLLVLIFFISIKNMFLFRAWVFFSLSFSFLLLLQSLIGVLFSGVTIDYGRFISSYLVIVFLAFVLYLSAIRYHIFLDCLQRTLIYLFNSFPVILFFAVVGITPVHNFDVNYSKPMFPFQEPSHYFNLLLLCSMVYAKSNKPMPVFFIFIISLFFYPSATGVIGFCVFLLFLLMKSNLKIKSILPVISVISIIFIFLIKFLGDYYLDRFIFWDSDNLSALVFLQGVESAYLGFIKSYGVGVGLGQMSSIVMQTSTDQSIFEITGVHFNIYDGSFVLSQILTEFGVLGLGFIIFLIYNLANCREMLRSNETKIWLPPTLIMSSLIEIFVRGYGFFSPIMLFCYFGLFYSYLNRSNAIN